MAYDLSDRHARDPLIAITLFIIIAIATTAIRLLSRRVKSVSFQQDDYLIVAGLVCISYCRVLHQLI